MARVTAPAFAFLGVDLAAILFGGPLPAVDAPTGRLAAFYGDHASRLQAQAYLRGVSMALLVWFAVALATAVADRSPRGAGSVFVASAVIVAAVELVRVAVVAAVLARPGMSSDSLPVMHAVGLILGAVIAFPIAVGQLAAARFLREVRASRWLAPAALLLSAGWLTTGIRTVSTSRALWVAGTVVTFAWGTWVAVVAVAVDRTAEVRG